MSRPTNLGPRSPLLDTTPGVAARVVARCGDAVPTPERRPALREHVGAELTEPHRPRRLAALAALGQLR